MSETVRDLAEAYLRVRRRQNHVGKWHNPKARCREYEALRRVTPEGATGSPGTGAVDVS